MQGLFLISRGEYLSLVIWTLKVKMWVHLKWMVMGGDIVFNMWVNICVEDDLNPACKVDKLGGYCSLFAFFIDIETGNKIQ